MISLTNQHVKCIFRNGTIVEGMVEEWVPGTVHLRSLSDQSLMIILHPDEDIMMIKVIPDPEEEIVVQDNAEDEIKSNSSLGQVQEQIRSKLKEVEDNKDPELEKLSVAELKRLAAEQEKKIIVDKIKEHFPGGTSRKANYASQLDFLPPGKRARRGGLFG
jgi:hypothetical protein